MSEQNTSDMSKHFYRASAADFMKIPSSPVAYWVSESFRGVFGRLKKLSDISTPKQGLATGDNNRFTRLWYEVVKSDISSNIKSYSESKLNNVKWVPYSKGGGQRRWYGFDDTVVLWENGGNEIRNFTDENGKERSRFRGYDYYFLPAATWGLITSASFTVRYRNYGAVFDIGGMSAFTESEREVNLVAYLNSNFVSEALKVINPTLNYQAGDIAKLPFKQEFLDSDTLYAKTNVLIDISKSDWNSFEVSQDFLANPITSSFRVPAHGYENQNLSLPTLTSEYSAWLTQNQSNIAEMQRLEEENNRIFIDAYGLQDELTPDVPLKEITLTCNPHYRYGGDLTEQEREDRLQSDTIAELISYAIGCMMGRYSLDREGLVYAHAGNQGFAELVSEGAYTTFVADDDAILPITEQEWFSDDVTNRVSEFVRTVYDEQHLEENLQFIADSLCLYAIKPKKGERALETIRRYLGTQFYKDHLKTYKRRPIYWLFSSGKHKAFECLVYLHRYHEGTLARMRTEYVIPLTARINARINRLHEEVEAASSTSERNQINRELKALQNQQAELATFDEQLRHHADMRISIDLDDGVKENYGKFGDLLAAVKDVTGKAAD